MEHIKKNINLYIKIIIAIIFAVIVFNVNGKNLLMYLDDQVYKEVFNSFSTFKTWAWEFYNIWSGRIITSALSTVFLRMPLIIFRICNVLVYLIGIISIFKIIKYITKLQNKLVENIIFASLFLISFTISREVINSGMMWVVGSFNYLWPTAFMLVALIPFIKILTNSEEKENKIFSVVFILSDFIACFAEQTALVLVTIGTIAILYKINNKEKINTLLIIHYILVVILTIIELSAPGNFVRFTASTLRRYPTFDMLNIGDKMLQGLILLGNQLLNFDIKIMLILTFIIAINNVIKKDAKIHIKIFSIIPFIYFASSYICTKIGILDGILYNLPPFGIEYIYGIKVYIPIFIFAINLGLIASLMIFSFNDIKTGILTTLIYLGSIASSLSISVSPTVYASGARVFFEMDALLIIVIGIFLINTLKYIKMMVAISNKKYLNKPCLDDKIKLEKNERS